MSGKLKLNVKNISLGFQNFSELLAGYESRINNGFSRLVVPGSIPRPDCKYYQQDYVRRTTLDYEKLVFTPPSEKHSLKRISTNIPLPGKWLDMVRSDPVYTPGHRFPWVITTYSSYFDRRDPQCPPPEPKRYPSDGKDPNRKSRPICPDTPRPPKEDTFDNKSKPKTGPCNRFSTFTVPLKICRFYSVKACTPKGGGDKDKGGEDPKDCKPKRCKPKSKKSKSSKKGAVCPPPKEVKGCPPKKSSDRCKPKKQKQRKSSQSGCRPVLKKPRDCAPKKSSSPPAPSGCEPKNQPKKPKC